MGTIVTRTWNVGIGLVWCLGGLSAAASARPGGAAPAHAAPSAQAFQWSKVALTDTMLNNIAGQLEALMRVEGVKRIYVMQADRSLFVQATPSGLGRLKATLASPDESAAPKSAH